MKTKQCKEESDKSIDEDSIIEPKTRGRKKAIDSNPEEEKKSTEEPKPSKEPKKNVGKPRAIIKKRPLGIRKTLRSKKVAVAKDKLKNVVKQTGKRGRKPAVKPETVDNSEKEALIPVTEIKKEPVDDTTPSSRSSSPKTAGRRQRINSDMAMMKSVLAESPNNLVLGPRTSPYSMRSERSNSPSMFETKNLRSGKPRKVKSNLLNEVVMKEQKKRRRLLSDSKADVTEAGEECKKLKRGRSCSGESSEISKCSEMTESDISLNETLNDTDSKELNKKLEKSKTDLDIDIENNIQISTIEQVPSLNNDSKLAETKPDTEPSNIAIEKNKSKLSLKRSTSLDSDNNNSNRLILLDNLNAELGDKLMAKTENDNLLDARSSILDSMSKTFNSKEMCKNIRKARRGRKAAAASRPTPQQAVKPVITSTITNDKADDNHETIETLSQEIDNLINNLDKNIDGDQDMANESNVTEKTTVLNQTKTVSKFYGLSKPLGDNNSIVSPETPVKDKDVSITPETTPSKIDDSENIRLHYEEDSVDRTTDNSRHEITYQSSGANIDKLMYRLKELEEFDKRRQKQESESKVGDGKTVMVSNDVVLIPKSGADIKPLKDIQSVKSPERPLQKENVLSNFFENNSAISIVKRDQARKSVDLDLPNSVTLIKRNSMSARKESTSSNHSKESDAISIFEKSLGKDVTLTEIRKSVDKTTPSAPSTPVEIHQFATLHPNNPTTTLAGMTLDSSQISIVPRSVGDTRLVTTDSLPAKRKSRESLSRKTSGSDVDEKMAVIEKLRSPPPPAINTPPPAAIKSPPPQAIKTPPPQAIKTPPIAITPTPIAVKSLEVQPVATEALPPPSENVKSIPGSTSLSSEIPKVDTTNLTDITKEVIKTDEVKMDTETIVSETKPTEEIKEPVIEEKADEKMNISVTESKLTPDKTDSSVVEQMVVDEVTGNKKEEVDTKEAKTEEVNKESAQQKPTDTPKATRSSKSARNSIESQPGPSSAIHETPESQKRKENVLRTLGLLTHKAAKEAKAKIEKQKEKDRISGPSCSGTMQYKNKAKSGDYTGTLKTVIKLSRGTDRDKKKCRSSLKMTFQKSKNRSGKPTPELGEMAEEDDAYTYTIERREGSAGTTSDGGHRKSHYSNRLNNHDLEAAPEPAESKDTPNLVIPEKASSFSIHPGRLCMDQCFYCGGKFGLFDTPCHIAQMKSSERQKKVLDNEEKLTVDSCLCDACYRHVDRRANCASYRKRGPLQPPPMPPTDTKSPPLESGGGGQSPPAPTSGRGAVCHTEGCSAVADHSIRRKWLIKMRTSVSKVLKLRYDYPGLHTIPLCAAHVAPLAPLLRCRLCRRQHKHNNLHLYNVNAAVINPWLESQHVPTSLPPRAALCKPCRHYAALAAAATANAANSATAGNVIDPFLVEHSRKLRQIYNVEEPQSDNKPQGECVPEDNKHKKKQRHKSKQRRSAEPDKHDSESSEKTTESSPEKDKNTDNSGNEGEKRTEHMEEDIETLISTNKIPVPGAVKATELPEGMDIENMLEHEMSIPFDKQTELQYLLQKQNNPTQFMQKPNLTHKSKNLLKIQTSVTGIQKPGYLQRIADKNAKRLQKLGQVILQKEKSKPEEEVSKEDADLLKNITLTDECTIETIPNKKSADINTLKNKWQMSESCMQVQKNLSLLSKKYSVEKDPKKSEHKFSNPVKRLETNPSISVRELFPGEEEMNLQCNIEFNNVREVTPEGWEKCNTTIQYDTDTKKLWSELQRPYGNQSSFLRHLILLEKYFRNGDLVLSHSATPLAANYSDSVQSRLRAYDNVATENPRKSEPAISLIEYRKKPSVNGKSLLKPSQDSDSELKKMPPPPPVLPKPKTKSDKPKKTLPPELIAINNPIQSRKQIQNVLHNIQQLVKGVSASDPTEVAAAPVVKETPREKKETPKEKPKKQKFASKPWRPTLMPITPEDLARAAREPMQVAADGRTLPTLVQVMSSGKRYHITIQDYNKMCIMRREKLQQDKEPKPKRMSTEETIVTEIQPSAILGNGGTVVQNILTETEKKDVPELGPITSNAATILKNVGLKNITIAAIPPKTATVTSQIIPSPVVTSPALIMTSTPIKIPQLGPAVSITSETILTPNLPVMSTMIMPKIPKSLTVIPQSVSATPISVSTPVSVAATPVMAVSTPANDPRP